MGKIADYLKNYENSSTATGYTAALYTFLDYLYGKQRKGRTVTPEEREKYEELVDKYLKGKRNYAEDMGGFVVSLHSRPPLSARQTFVFVKEFFNHYDVELSAKDLKFIRHKLPKGNVRTIEKDLDIDTIRTILQHLDTKGRALCLALASSGMRINEALSLELDDINFETKPTMITIRGTITKNGDNRITFLSREATQAVTEWLKIRLDYIQSSSKRNHGLAGIGKGNLKSIVDDGRLFPFSDQNASVMWENALSKAGLLSHDKTTKRKQLHYHQFRKFFISQLSLIVSKEIAETLAGHNGYLTDAYRRYTRKQLAEEYLKGEHLLTIQAPKELQEMESEFKGKLQTHEGIITNLVKENIEMKKHIDELTEGNKQLKQEFDDIGFILKFILNSKIQFENGEEAKFVSIPIEARLPSGEKFDLGTFREIVKND